MSPVNYERYLHGATSSEETPIAQYIEKTAIVRIEPVGEKRGRNKCVLTEKAKFLISSLLQGLQYCHQNGACLPRFDASNVVVTDSGRAKLKGLEWKMKEDELVLQNYRDAHQILTKTVFREYHWGALPEDMKHLLKLMKSDSAIKMEYVIRTHASLVPIGTRYLFFILMYEHIKSALHHTVQQRIMNALPYGDDWVTRLEGNRLLEESFEYRKYDPSNGPMEFLDYYRNTVAHRMARNGKPLTYTPDDFEQILVVTFPMYLPIMQRELEKENQLRGLKLHLLFPASK